MDNKTSIEFARKRKIGGIANAKKATKLYDEYIAHPTAQYTMTFSEFKKTHNKNRRKKKR